MRSMTEGIESNASVSLSAEPDPFHHAKHGPPPLINKGRQKAANFNLFA